MMATACSAAAGSGAWLDRPRPISYMRAAWRGSSVGQSSGLISRRSAVQIRPPLPLKSALNQCDGLEEGRHRRPFSCRNDPNLFPSISAEFEPSAAISCDKNATQSAEIPRSATALPDTYKGPSACPKSCDMRSRIFRHIAICSELDTISGSKESVGSTAYLKIVSNLLR